MPTATLYGKRVLVTGADGFIGSHLCERLVRDGAELTALAFYNSFGSRGWIDSIDDAVLSAMTVVSGDVRDPHFMRSIINGQDIVFHLAALIAIPYSYCAPASYVDTNVSGTLNVLEACKAAGVLRLVHTSTSEVYGTAQFTPITEAHPLQGQSPYSASKIGADHMVDAYARTFDLPAVTLRPFNTFGPRQSERAVIPTLIRQYLDPKCEEVRIGDLNPIRDFNYVEDTADAFVQIATASDHALSFGAAYNAGSGRGVTIGQTAELIRHIIGIEKPLSQDYVRLRPAKSEVFELLADASRLAGATGWTSAIGFEEGLSRTIDWWRVQLLEGRLRQDSGYLV
jgi:UDP-glucose 4-epimerase